jgi:hypothetical protein
MQEALAADCSRFRMDLPHVAKVEGEGLEGMAADWEGVIAGRGALLRAWRGAFGTGGAFVSSAFWEEICISSHLHSCLIRCFEPPIACFFGSRTVKQSFDKAVGYAVI